MIWYNRSAIQDLVHSVSLNKPQAIDNLHNPPRKRLHIRYHTNLNTMDGSMTRTHIERPSRDGTLCYNRKYGRVRSVPAEIDLEGRTRDKIDGGAGTATR
jgi:hypothetical protein